MTTTTGPDRWEELGAALVRRRVNLDPRYRNRGAFCEATGLKYRLVYDIEEHRRTNFGPATLTSVEVAYNLEPGAIGRFLDGGSLEPGASAGAAPASPADIKWPYEAREGTHFTAENRTGAGRYAFGAYVLLHELRGRGIATPRGWQVFPGNDALAAGYEGALGEGETPEEAIQWAATVLADMERMRREQQGGRSGSRGA